MHLILALDLGKRTGWALGESGGSAIPRSGAVVLTDGDFRDVAIYNLLNWLSNLLAAERPAIIAVEAPPTLEAFKSMGNSQDRVRMGYALHGVVEALAYGYRAELREIHYATVRKHFIGTGKMGERGLTKEAVVRRAQALGYLPKGINDDDRADALANWDYTAARPPEKLYLFGEAAE